MIVGVNVPACDIAIITWRLHDPELAPDNCEIHISRPTPQDALSFSLLYVGENRTPLPYTVNRAHNDGFFLNALKSLFRLFQCTFRYLETHSKRRCKICFCFRHPRGAWRFSKLQGLLCSFSENRCNWAFYEIEIFCDSSVYHIFESENFRFPFSLKIYRLTWRVKCENLNFRNS